MSASDLNNLIALLKNASKDDLVEIRTLCDMRYEEIQKEYWKSYYADLGEAA